jgi:NAD(P)-dependent dehydrogenase (short-subunit alcohol dehydrogenase family)
MGDAGHRCWIAALRRLLVVTGASKGMGLAIARTLGGAGARVIVSART